MSRARRLWYRIHSQWILPDDRVAPSGVRFFYFLYISLFKMYFFVISPPGLCLAVSLSCLFFFLVLLGSTFGFAQFPQAGRIFNYRKHILLIRWVFLSSFSHSSMVRTSVGALNSDTWNLSLSCLNFN